MATGHSNQLTGQIGEYLVCAELGRRGLIATSFTGNVPEYDLLVCDEGLRSLPIQVKTTRSTTWPSRADLWLDIEIDDMAKQQVNHGRKEIPNPELIYVCVALGATRREDRFFICTKTDIQDACIKSYTDWMAPKDWKRPKNYKSLDNRYGVEHLAAFEDHWQLITERLNEL
jgi:hypothetical protein